MVLGIAEGKLEGGEAAEVVARLELLGHAHAAVDLDGFLTDGAAGAADDDITRARSFASFSSLRSEAR